MIISGYDRSGMLIVRRDVEGAQTPYSEASESKTMQIYRI